MKSNIRFFVCRKLRFHLVFEYFAYALSAFFRFRKCFADAGRYLSGSPRQLFFSANSDKHVS